MIISGAICDKCNEKLIYWNHLSKQNTIKSVRDRGWSIGKDGKCICPKCKEKKKQERNK